jgi:hypothetical protein
MMNKAIDKGSDLKSGFVLIREMRFDVNDFELLFVFLSQDCLYSAIVQVLDSDIGSYFGQVGELL